MDYKLTEQEQATLNSLRDKGAFGVGWLLWWEGTSMEFSGWCCDKREIPSDEAAYALMVQRGLKELGEKWDVPWYCVVVTLAERFQTADTLAAILAALGE